MSFLIETAEKLQMPLENLPPAEQKRLMSETFREVHRAGLRALSQNLDGQSLSQLDGGQVRLKVCNFISQQRRYSEVDLRQMLSETGGDKQPFHPWDQLQVGCIPYHNYLLFWHIQVYRNRRISSIRRLPVRNLSEFEFRVLVSAESATSTQRRG